ncbi:hypothetical protein MTO96_044870 [Rhipicephalus appendiculatus]
MMEKPILEPEGDTPRKQRSRTGWGFLASCAVNAGLLSAIALVVVLYPSDVEEPHANRNRQTLTPLLCTVSNNFNAQSKLPPDGLCDLLFYDSLYRDDRNEVNGPFDEGAQRFLDLPNKMKLTGIGVSLDVDHRRFLNFRENWPWIIVPGFRTGIDNLWERGVSHFGMLNIYKRYDINRVLVPTYLHVMQRIYARVQAKAQAANRTAYTVFGFRFNDTKHSYQVIEYIEHKNWFKPSLYVAVSHISFADWREKPCHILPSTIFKFPGNVNRRGMIHGQALMDVMDHLNWTVKNNVSIPMAISFTMRARLYKPANLENGSDAYAAYRMCQSHTGVSDVVPATLCDGSYDSHFQELATEGSVITYDTAKQRSATFETDDTLKKKVCHAKEAFPDIPFGVAAYDIEYDVAESACPPQHIRAGDFKRVETLKDLRDFVRDKFRHAGLLEDCLVLPSA